LGAGIYTIPEAARLSKVSPHRIRRWLKGYSFKTSRTKRLRSAPVWQSQLTPIKGTIAVGFRDLMEIRFVAAFIGQGVTWKTMRLAHAAAKETLDTDHPFCTHRFATDGLHILQQEIEEAGDRRFTDIVTNQREFDSIVTPFLRELDFDGGVLRWWPLGRDHAVVLDPGRSLGQPIVANGGVQTRILSNSVKANDDSIEVVARWFEVAVEEVRDAVEFEKSLLAA